MHFCFFSHRKLSVLEIETVTHEQSYVSADRLNVQKIYKTKVYIIHRMPNEIKFLKKVNFINDIFH